MTSPLPEEKVRRIRVYDVEVRGYGTGAVLAASPSKARYSAYLSDAFDHLTFGQFLKLCSVRLAPIQPGDGYERLRSQYPFCCIPNPGTRIRAEGYTGTVLPAVRATSYVIFQPDGKEHEVRVHPMSVELARPHD